MKTKLGYFMIPLLSLLIAGCSTEKKENKMPDTRKDSVVTNYFGIQVADPFRWLENGDSPEVKKWIEYQNNYTNKVLSGFSEAGKMESRIKELETTSSEKYDPRFINDRLYFMQSTPPQAQAVIASQTWPDGSTNILVDP